MQVVAYYRYSTDNKGQVDNSEYRQKDSVERIVYGKARQGWKLIASYTDKAVSGTDDKPELLKLRQLVEDGDLKVDVIAVDALSRLSRRSLMDIGSDINWIKDANIKLSIASRNNGEPFTVDEFSDDLALMVDQYQNNQYVKKLSREVTNGLRTKFEKGTLGWTGKAPYGYELRKLVDEPTTLIPNNDLEIVGEIFQRFLAGESIRSLIALIEKTEQYKEGNYKRPNASTVKNILRSSIYAGIRTFGVRGVGKHSTVAGTKRTQVAQNPLVQASHWIEYKPEGFRACVSVDEYKKVQDILDANAKAFRKRPDRRRHKWSGYLRCAECNTPMIATTFTNKNTQEVKVKYVCPRSVDGTSVCKSSEKPNAKAIRTDELEKMIAKQFGIILMSKDFHKRNLEDIVKRLVDRSKTNVAKVEEDLEIQSRRLDELVELWASSGSPSLKDLIDEQTRKLDAIKSKINESVGEDKLLEFAKEQHDQMGDAGILNSYFGHLYDTALPIATLTHFEDRQELIEHAAIGLVKLWSKALNDGLKDLANRKGMEPPEWDWGDVEVTLSGSDEAIFSGLRSMGLDHMKVSFELGLFRGKPRRVPTELSFVFLVVGKRSTDTGSLLISNQKVWFSPIE